MAVFRFFWRPVIKRFALCYPTVVCPVCDVGILWPNGWMDQDATWHGGRPRPRSQCLMGTQLLPPLKGAQQPPFFGLHIIAKRSHISATAELLFKMAAAAFLKFQKCLTVGRVKRLNLRHRAIFLADRSNRCRDMAVFRYFSRRRPPAILDLSSACSDHSRMAFGGF